MLCYIMLFYIKVNKFQPNEIHFDFQKVENKMKIKWKHMSKQYK